MFTHLQRILPISIRLLLLRASLIHTLYPNIIIIGVYTFNNIGIFTIENMNMKTFYKCPCIYLNRLRPFFWLVCMLVSTDLLRYFKTAADYVLPPLTDFNTYNEPFQYCILDHPNV